MKSKVLLMDNIAFMKSQKDKSFDLAIVDPPYGIGATTFSNGSRDNHLSTAKKIHKAFSGGGKLKHRILNKSQIDWDNAPPPAEYFRELFRVSKNQIIWGGNYFKLPPSRCWIVWDKMQPWDNFSQFEIAWTSFHKPSKMFKISTRGGANKVKKIHPTEKPIELYLKTLHHFASQDIKILDTNLGSGNSRIACEMANMNIDFTGIEISDLYYESHILSWNKFIQNNIQHRLFK